MQCLYMAGTTTKCPLLGGICLQEVSFSRGLTLYDIGENFTSLI